MIEAGSTYPIKLLVAAAGSSNSLVVDVHGDAAEDLCAENGPDLDDWGLDRPEDIGLWVFDGSAFFPPEDPGDGYETDFAGEWRRATAEEASRFAAGQSVWRSTQEPT